MIAYADTGFLISLYREDDLSGEASALIVAKPVFLLTPLIEAEFANALQLALFRKSSTLAETRMIQESFTQHQVSGVFRVAPLEPEVWEKAAMLSRTHSAKLGTRTLDILHVASALILKPDVFYTFDRRQRKLAQAAGLRVLPD